MESLIFRILQGNSINMMCQSKVSTFAIRTSQRTYQKLQKSLLCQRTEKNKIFALLKNNTLQTRSPTDKNDLRNDIKQENNKGQLVTKAICNAGFSG